MKKGVTLSHSANGKVGAQRSQVTYRVSQSGYVEELGLEPLSNSRSYVLILLSPPEKGEVIDGIS